MIWQIAALLLMVVVNLILWIFAMPWYVNWKISRFQNDLVDRHYDEVEIMYRTMREWRHDYHNHIQTLKAYLAMVQYEKASKYLDRLEEDLANVDMVLRTGNVMVDAILNSKLTLIQERNIQVNATAHVPDNLPVSDIDLSVLIGNLMDNAMEACELVPEQERFIRVFIDVMKQQLYICITNSMFGNPKRKGNHLVSMKKGDHGFGLLRVDDIVTKHNGYINRQMEKGVFATEIMLPIVKSKEAEHM